MRTDWTNFQPKIVLSVADKTDRNMGRPCCGGSCIGGNCKAAPTIKQVLK